jgi:hypothetical protein
MKLCRFAVVELFSNVTKLKNLTSKIGKGRKIKFGRIDSSRSQYYKNLISSFFRFLKLSLSVCSMRKYYLSFKMPKLNSKKNIKNLHFTKKKVW